MTQDASAAARREEAIRILATRDLSLSQAEKAVKEGLRTLAQYRAFLKDQGFREEDVAVLSGLLDAEIRRAKAKSAAAA
jgi:maltooligosyltrehalose synthase